MRRTLALVLLITASTALADTKEVEGVVKKNIVGLGKLEDNDKLGLAETATVINHMGTKVDLSQEDGCVSGAVANSFYGCQQVSITHKPGTISVGVDDAKGIAWFHAPYTAVLEGEDPESSKPSISKIAMRTSGILIKNGKNWEIVAQLYSQLVSDKELLAGTGGKVASGKPKLTGDAKLGAAVAGWFTSGFAPAVAKSGTLVASGTSPATSEFKTGADASKLAASFDKLKLGATSIDAKVFAKGAVGWASAVVMMPRKNGKGAVEMNLAVVAVPDGDSWRWVSLMYQFPWNPMGR